ncbi:MAG: putative metal-dependent hydrolase of the TIM-barrel fold [Armatimonadetes bacterium]|nr:putative metal-dependent hydrolase of the TIM-barrel fold [Armatimonadota bacterium]
MTIIEPHVHVWSLDTERYPWSPLTTQPPAESATTEDLIETLDAHGIAGAVLVQVIHYGTDNSYAAEALRRFPDRFAGVCLVDPLAPDAPQKLEYEVRERGFSGVRLRPCADRSATWLGDPATFPLWEKAAELGASICILGHVDQLPLLAAPLERFPTVPVIIDHMAWPPVEEGPDGDALQHLLALERSPQVYVKITDPWAMSKEAYPYRRAESIFRRVFETFGPERCLWGSDWPLVRDQCGYGRALGLYTSEWSWLTDSDREWILCKTIQKLYPRPFAAL